MCCAWWYVVKKQSPGWPQDPLININNDDFRLCTRDSETFLPYLVLNHLPRPTHLQTAAEGVHQTFILAWTVSPPSVIKLLVTST
jgi:hypothetical protein